MTYSRFDTLFEKFFIDIALTLTQSKKIDDAMEEALSLFLATYEDDIDIYAQGSYAMGTTAKPLTKYESKTSDAGEYDIDIVLERTGWGKARESLETLRIDLENTYPNKVDQKLRDTCERVEHYEDKATGVGFHVDYVPIKLNVTRKAAKRPINEWFNSDTKKLVEWFKDYVSTYRYLPAIILSVKRMRDYSNLNSTLSSIAITALVTQHYTEGESYGDEILDVLLKIITQIDVPYVDLSITIPVIEDDLADRISKEQHIEIIDFFKASYRGILEGLRNSNLSKLRDVLSPAFPSDLSKYPEVLESLRNRNWGIELDGSLVKLDIAERKGKGNWIRNSKRKFFSTGEQLAFEASTNYSRSEYGIRWQVLNSSLSGTNNRRGKLFKARGPSGAEGSSSNEFINYETEEYDGEHWIKYYMYEKSTGKVVEIGNKFYVEVQKSI